MDDYKEPKISQITVGGNRIGLRNLNEALEKVRAMNIANETDLERALVQALRDMKNYIPDSAEAKYGAAVLREYRKAMGQAFEDEPKEGLTIRILGQGCPNCHRLTQEVMAALTNIGLPADVEHVTDVNQIADYGVVGAPALLINGKVKSVGRVPSRNQIWEWIKDEADKR